MAANFFLNKASEVSISTVIDLLIANMIIYSRLDASFPVKGANNVKNLKKCELTEYIDIALSDLVFVCFFFHGTCCIWIQNPIHSNNNEQAEAQRCSVHIIIDKA